MQASGTTQLHVHSSFHSKTQGERCINSRIFIITFYDLPASTVRKHLPLKTVRLVTSQLANRFFKYFCFNFLYMSKGDKTVDLLSYFLTRFVMMKSQ